VRQTALADAIGIEGASLVRLLDELQSSGLITREQDPTDRRANSVNLTERGRTVVEAVNETLTALRLEVFAATPRKDVEAAIRIFKTLEAAAARGDETA
jgi:MarR family transcriptional regulator for hemolysin